MQIEAKLNQLHDDPEHDIEVFQDESTIKELEKLPF